MSNKLRIILIICSLLIVTTSIEGYSAYWEVDIDADYSYNDKVREVIIAKGNCKARSKDFYIESPYIKYYYNEKRIVAEDRFFIEIEGYKIFGSKLDYYFRKKTGVAGIVRIKFGDTYLGGSWMTIRKDKLRLNNAYFTDCNKPDSDYHFSANELVLFPKTGLIVAYWATAWVGPAPVIPVPTFVYTAKVPPSKFGKKPAKKVRKATEEERKQARIEKKKKYQPIPELKSNSEDGLYLKQGFNWYFGPKWYAKSYISFIENKGVGLGLRTNYIINDVNEGEIRYGQTTEDKGFGGLTHIYSFGPKIVAPEEEEWMIYDTYEPGGKYAYELEYNQSHGERLYLDENRGPYNRLTFDPKVTLRSNRQELPIIGDPFTYYMEGNTALVSEEPISTSLTSFPVESRRTQYFADIKVSQNLGFLGDFSLVYDYNSLDYPTVDMYWRRSTQRSTLTQRYFDTFEIDYGHVHYMVQDGSGSPFEFESYNFSPFDQFYGALKWKYWWSSFKIATTYDLPSNDLFSVKYNMDFGMHCYDLKFGYKIYMKPEPRHEFGFTWGLTRSRWVEK